MKNNKNIKFLSLFKLFRDGVKSDTMVSLNNSFELLGLLRKYGWRMLYATMPSIVNLTKRLSQLQSFGRYILRMNKNHGSMYTVKYLKSSQLSIQRYIAGNSVSSLREIEPDLNLCRLTSGGLPRIIPLSDRRLIKARSPSVIRWWLTLFSLYRVIRVPGKLKLETIISPLSVPIENVQEVASSLKTLCLMLKSKFPVVTIDSNTGLLPLETASPHHRSS